MKFYQNKEQKFFIFFTLLSLYTTSTAIFTYIALFNFKPLLSNEISVATTQDKGRQNVQSNEVLEEINLDREWEDILGDESGGEMLLAAGRGI
ncbi:MAG: hypothetical protein F6K45_19185 [Kamptonema sp. SIO1D9]|nr:hypothetical protein [Kamptonema sp. SIO1D9]